MEWLERMKGAIYYIEENLSNDIDYNEVAKIACCSTYHFQRMFSFITDVPLSEYIRRRRLTLAAFELQNSSTKILDIALKYGYDSPNSFTRAFQNLHGVTPSVAREKGVQLKAYPSISFHISIKGDVEMNYKIEEKGSFKVIGVEAIINTTNEENFTTIPKFWQECGHKGILERLGEIEINNKLEGLGKTNSIMCYRNTGEDSFPYMIGVIDFDGSANAPQDLLSVEVKPYTWAIFRTEDHGYEDASEKIQAVWRRIFPEWFPTSGYEHDCGPELELTYNIEGDRFYSEVWIPVVKK
ncbi:AraC family transcriptional regulator [Alkaliphilus transvaalensis]|uniref:AraC family transcriptional regulator n=1 Tax=Alkaliphilus transvaalensis TaxID=114628 RepID=UPI000478ADFD|nr:AraC family transcriptional regulator [Alkaliphilus transvaalensis]